MLVDLLPSVLFHTSNYFPAFLVNSDQNIAGNSHILHLSDFLFKEKIYNLISSVPQDFKSQRQKIVRHTIGGIDLNPTQQCNATGNHIALADHNLLHELVLRLKERKGQFHHGIFGLSKLIGIRQEHVSHVGLLRVERIDGHVGLFLAF